MKQIDMFDDLLHGLSALQTGGSVLTRNGCPIAQGSETTIRLNTSYALALSQARRCS